jgi:hypothetical protein
MNIKNEIQKATFKHDRCEVIFKENVVEENYSNDVTKKCNQIAHPDLKAAFDALVPFLITITEQPEQTFFDASNIDHAVILSEEEKMKVEKYVVTGYSKGGSDETAGVTLIGQKILKSGKVLNLCAPFVQFEDDSPDAYAYGNQLASAIDICDDEVKQYLFEGKAGIKQEELDFDVPEDMDLEKISAEIEEKPKKRGKKKKVEMALAS